MTTRYPLDDSPHVSRVAISLTATLRPNGEIERLSIEGRSLTTGRVEFHIRPRIDGAVHSLEELLAASDVWIWLLEDSITAP